MQRNLVCVDVETTGLSKQTDRIIQLSAVKFDKNFKMLDRWNHYIKPSGTFTINEKAKEVHGIDEKTLDNLGEKLKDLIPDFLKFIEDCDYVTYNGNNFDIAMLYADFEREGAEFPIEGRKFYDVMSMERKLRPGNLGAVFQRYTGQTMEEAGLAAHDSQADVIATMTVMQKQFETHNLNWEEVGEWQENQMISPEGSIRNAGTSETGDLLVFAVGKYRDSDVFDIMQKDADYCRWWSTNVATTYTRNKVRAYVQKRLVETKKEQKKKGSSKQKSKK